MTGLFSPPYEFLIMWQCFMENKDPLACHQRIEDFKKYEAQVRMHERAKKLEKKKKK